MFVFSFYYDLHSPELNKYGDNVWFQGDITRIYDNMTNRHAYGHYRANVHPIYSLLTYPPTFLLKKLFSSDALAIKSVTLTIAALWLISLYTLLRIIGCLRLDAMILTLVGTSCSAVMFWLYIPETYALASVSLIFALGLSMLASQRRLPDWVFSAVNAFSIGITITNWMAGLLATLTSLAIKRALKVFSIAIAAIILLWCLQKLIFPAAEFFVGSSEESKFMFTPTAERFCEVSRSFFIHSIVAPELRVTELNQFSWPILSFQTSSVGSSGILGWIATGLWILLLSFGVCSLFIARLPISFKITLAMTLIGQLTLHIVYGEETFLYTLNFVPLLVVLAAVSTLTNLRKITISLCLFLIPILTINNLTQLKLASAIASPTYTVGDKLAP